MSQAFYKNTNLNFSILKPSEFTSETFNYNILKSGYPTTGSYMYIVSTINSITNCNYYVLPLDNTPNTTTTLIFKMYYAQSSYDLGIAFSSAIPAGSTVGSYNTQPQPMSNFVSSNMTAGVFVGTNNVAFSISIGDWCVWTVTYTKTASNATMSISVLNTRTGITYSPGNNNNYSFGNIPSNTSITIGGTNSLGNGNIFIRIPSYSVY